MALKEGLDRRYKPKEVKEVFELTTRDAQEYLQRMLNASLAAARDAGENVPPTVPVELETFVDRNQSTKFKPFLVSLPVTVLERNSRENDVDPIFRENRENAGGKRKMESRIITPVYMAFARYMYPKEEVNLMRTNPDFRDKMDVTAKFVNQLSPYMHWVDPRGRNDGKSQNIVCILNPCAVFADMTADDHEREVYKKAMEQVNEQARKYKWPRSTITDKFREIVYPFILRVEKTEQLNDGNYRYRLQKESRHKNRKGKGKGGKWSKEITRGW